MKFKIVTISILCLILCIGCSEPKQTDAIKFKEEYEKYNDKKIKLDIDEENIVKYATSEKINNLIKDKTGVIFIGKPNDNLSRTAINILLQAADSTDLNAIYYIDNLDNIEGLNDIKDPKIPLVINILEGKIVSYHIGTIDDKTKLSEDEEMQLYNIYLDSIHEVLQDSCDERC